MTLTLGHAPLSTHPAREVNYTLDGPAHKLLLTPFPRRVRGVFAGETVIDTTRGALLHESNLLPRLYVPAEDVRSDLLARTDQATHCPFKGDAVYWTVRVGDRVAENAIWAYPDPLPAASWLRGLVAPYPERLDAWYDEGERIEGHLRDPFHRVDVRAASRPVRVRAGDEVVAESDRAMVLSENGVPNRYYVPREGVRADLDPSETTSHCPYKGHATYWTVRVGERRLEDAAWSYAEPFDDAFRVAGHVAFLHADLVVEAGP